MFFSGKIKSMNYPDGMKAKAMVKSNDSFKEERSLSMMRK
jgi:hypothetical protein